VGIEKLENEEPSYGSYSKLVLISTIIGIRVCTTCDVVVMPAMSSLVLLILALNILI